MMPGVVRYIDGPCYKSKPLINVPLYRKLIFGSFVSLTVIPSILAFVLLVIIVRDHHPEDETMSKISGKQGSIIGIYFLTIAELLLIFLLPLFAYLECCAKQFVQCSLPKGKRYLCAWILPLSMWTSLMVLGSIYSDCNVSVKIVSIAINVIANLSVMIGLCLTKHYCQCKTCLKLEDVKLIYKNQIFFVTEKDVITSARLASWFKIPISNVTRLALQIKDGAIIYEFNEQNKQVELHEGEYLIREITHLVNPVEDCTVRKTCSPPSNLSDTKEVDAQGCSIMTID